MAREEACQSEIFVHFSDVDHLSVNSLPRSWQCHVGFHLFFCQVGNQEGEKKRRLRTPVTLPPSSCVSLCTSWLLPCLSALCKSASREARLAVSLPSTQLPIQRACAVRASCVQRSRSGARKVSPNFPIFSLRVACSDTSLSRRVDSFFCASFPLAVRWRKNVFAISLMQSTQGAQCSTTVGLSRNMSNFGFAFSKARFDACSNSSRFVSLLQAVCCRLQVPSLPLPCCRRLSSLRL